MFRKLNYQWQRLLDFLTRGIWELETQTFSKMKARLLTDLKVVLIIARDFGRHNLGGEAASLCYFTAMAFIPLIAVVFAVTGGLGLDTYLRELTFHYFSSNSEIVALIMRFADNIVASTENGIYGIISFLVFVWLVVWLMLNVESSFNRIWKVDVSRVLWKRILAYIAILILSPFVLLLFLSITVNLTQFMDGWKEVIPGIHYVKPFLSWLISYGVILLVMTALYKFIPNARVHFRSAFGAALFAALAFIVIQYLYLETQFFVSRLNSVYGAFAALPLFMAWMNIEWSIILTGAELSYALQFVHNPQFKFIKETNE